MLRKGIQLKQDVERLIDAGIAWVALSLAVGVRREMTAQWPTIFQPFDFWPEGGWLYLVLIILWVILLDAFRLYEPTAATSVARKTFFKLLQVNALGVVLTFFIFYFLSLKHVPRILVLLYCAIHVLLMMAKHIFLLKLEPKWLPRKTFLLIGLPGQFAEFLNLCSKTHTWHINVIGLLTPEGYQPGDTQLACPHLGSSEDLLETLHKNSVDFVVLAPSQEHFTEVQNIINMCETEGVETWLLGSLFTTRIAKARVEEFHDLPVLTFSTTPAVSWALLVKRLIDIVGSLALILLTSPIMILATLAIKYTSPGAVLFKQERCTLYGRVFTMYKFRTMVDEAEQLRSELESRNEQPGPSFKMKKDPRVTKIGRFMRRHSIDELPQLFNVLKGDMSLVGPRPVMPFEVAKYESWQRRRLSMRSGMTCLWQVKGRNEVAFEDWMKLDLKYIDRWSLLLDFKILIQTPAAVWRGTGF